MYLTSQDSILWRPLPPQGAQLAQTMPEQKPCIEQFALAQVLAVHHEMLTPAVVAAARAAGKRVHAFVADTPATAAAVLAAGVDGIVTNWPQRVAAMSARLAACCAGGPGAGSCGVAALKRSAMRQQ